MIRMLRMMELTVGELLRSGRRGRRAGVAGRGRANLLRGFAAEARPRPATLARRPRRPLRGSSPTVSSVSSVILIILIILFILLIILFASVSYTHLTLPTILRV